MENNPDERTTGVVLMTYGSATTAEHVPEYFEHIYHGKASADLIRDFEERYRLVGHSPLTEITQKQAHLLEDMLGQKGKGRYIVRVGMLHSKPFIEEAVRDCKNAGAERCIGIILSPQFSSFIMEAYRSRFTLAARECGFREEDIFVVKPWPTEPNFIRLLGDHIRASLKELERAHQGKVPVIFTTHSLPKRVVEKDPGYLDQLRSTIDATVEYIADPTLEWYAGYQSAGHTSEEWLKPDLADILADLQKDGKTTVLIAPIQFLADHLEILYDLDIAAKKQCEDLGIAYHRILLPNIDPLFIKSLASLVENAYDH